MNWKELADQFTTDELMLEIDQALDDSHDAESPLSQKPARDEVPHINGESVRLEESPDATDDTILDLSEAMEAADNAPQDIPTPGFGMDFSHLGLADDDDDDDEVSDYDFGREDADADMPMSTHSSGLTPMRETGSSEDIDEFGDDDDETAFSDDFASLAAGIDDDFADEDDDNDSEEYDHDFANAAVESAPHIAEVADDQPEEPEIRDEIASPVFMDSPSDLAFAEPDESEMGLGDWLASARELAEAANFSEDRTRQTLYAAISKAYDFSVVAGEEPQEFEELLADSGLTMQDRAPMTPVVKLVFGANYDKTRLTEYAAALSHGHRLGVPKGDLGDFLAGYDGGLKGVVKAERRLRREESGKPVEPEGAPRESLARKLRKLEPQGFDAIPDDGAEFALVMVRRMPDGSIAMLGEVPDDVALVERAARKLLG
ncbi:MAG: hypothetical protein R3E21_13530 [Caenibius sp.]